MGITKFLYLLLAFSIAIVFYDIDQVDSTSDEAERPLVSFYDTVMYNIDTNSVNNIIPAKEAYLYDGREEMVGATIVTKAQEKQYKKNTNSVSSDNMVKIGDEVYLDGNVDLQMANGMQLKTEQLQYNLKTKVAQNEQRFVVTKDFHDFYGRHLYYDMSKKNLQAKDTHFNIKVENE